MRQSDGLPVLSVLAIAALASSAYADTEAAELFNRGVELRKAGNYAEACPLFEQSMRLAPAIGTLLNVADCRRQQGRYAEAIALFERAEREATTAGKPAAAKLARDKITELETQVPFLTIELGALPSGTVVELDGKPVAAGAKVPVDAGPHEIRAAGARPVRYVAKVGHAGTVTLEPAAHVRPREVWILGGAAAGTLLVGAIAGVATLRRRDSALAQCDANVMCSQDALDQLNSARTLSHMTTGLFVIGLGLAGAAGYFEWKSRREVPPIVIEPGADRLTVAVGGRW
jgi:tetratricopeptide (TPR) repeat protein